MILALHDASTSYSYNLGRFCGMLLLAALVVAIFQSRFTGKPVFSSQAKYILIAVVLIAAGIFFLLHLPSSKPMATWPPPTTNPPVTQPPTVLPVRDQQLDQFLAEAQTRYSALEKQRAGLDPKNIRAVRAFNQQAGAYQALLKRIEESRRLQASTGVQTKP